MIIDVVDPATGQRYIYIDDAEGSSLCDAPSDANYTHGKCRCLRCTEAHRIAEETRRCRRRKRSRR